MTVRVFFPHANLIAQTTYVLRKPVTIIVAQLLKLIVKRGQIDVRLILHIMDVPTKRVQML